GVLEAQLAQKPDALAEGNLRLDLGRFRALSGDAIGATSDLEKARSILQAEYLRQPKNAGVLNSLASAYCYMGDRANALNYVQRAIGLSPAGSRYEDTQMRIWAYFGDKDLALAALERLQKTPGDDYTPAMLRLDPIFDKLRDDARFQALAADE